MFKGHPKGLIAAALANMGERFGYYIMNAVLVLFLCSKFGLSEETSGTIYSFFYAGIYLLALVGGAIADRTQNYKGTIRTGLIIMATGYVLLSIPILATSTNIAWLLPLTCFALFMIAFGNGLFKGNLQAIVGQLYDDFEAEAAKQGPEALKIAKSKRDSGFQIFYVFINVGGLIAPFIAPLLREWWLGANGMAYNAQLPALCHEFINNGTQMSQAALDNLNALMTAAGGNVAELTSACQNYLQIFNEGIHYSFIASVVAMVISLIIFVAYQRRFPTPGKKTKVESQSYTAEETGNGQRNQTTYGCLVRRFGYRYFLLVLVPPKWYVSFFLCTRFCRFERSRSGDLAGNQSFLRYYAYPYCYGFVRLVEPSGKRNIDTP